MATTSTGHGYWLASADGRVFGYGDAAVFVRAAAARARSIGISRRAGASVVGIATSANVRGFWLAADGSAGTKAEDAIAWFQAREGSSSYEHLCETAVELAFGTINRYPSARANWLAQPALHRDWRNAPRGALVYYDTSRDGHVAISLGNGEIISTSINGRIDVAPIGFLQNPVGWAPQPW